MSRKRQFQSLDSNEEHTPPMNHKQMRAGRSSSLEDITIPLQSQYRRGPVTDIDVLGRWIKHFEEENNSDSPYEYIHRWSEGLKTTQSVESTIVAKVAVGNSLSVGDKFSILQIKYEDSITKRQSSVTEIHKTRERTLKFTILPWTKLVRWQFVADIAGNVFDFNLTKTFNDDTFPEAFNITVTVRMKKEILLGKTPIRIKHKETGKYLTIVKRLGWPAATLGLSNQHHFILESRNEGIKINALNSPFVGYKFLSGWGVVSFWIYFGKDENFYMCRCQFWSIAKESPLYDGDDVTFLNKHYDNRYLCYNSAAIGGTDVYCMEKKEDEWILEVVYEESLRNPHRLPME